MMTQSVDALLLTAEKALQAGDIRTTADIGQQVLLRDSRNADAYLLMAKVAFAVKKMDSALRYIEKAIGCRPDVAAHYEWKGRILAATGHAQEASTAYEWAARILCQENFHFMPQGMAVTVCGYVEQAITLQPGRTELFCLLGDLYFHTASLDKALYCFQKVLKQQPNNTTALLGVGRVYATSHQYVEALRYVDQALDAQANITSYVAKARLLEYMNRLDESHEALTEARRRFPDRLEWLVPLAKLERRQGRVKQALAHLERLMSSNTMLCQNPWVWHELAQLLEIEGRYREAFTLFTKVNQHEARKAEQQNIRGQEVDEAIRRRQHYYAPRPAAVTAPSVSSETPIFLVGFPRSGTTLMEQMLSAHSGIFATQEIAVIYELAEELPSLLGRQCAYPEGLDTITLEERHYLQQAYWQKITTLFKGKIAGKRLVHKMPLDITLLGMIQLLFPASAVLVMMRDPRDVVLSCFQQMFGLNESMVHFTTIDYAAEFYRDVMELYGHYRRCLPLNIHEVRYESLVAAADAELRAVFDFVKMPWEEGVLSYYSEQNNRLVTTPSYDGVMKPVYDHSIGRWRHYQPELAGILPILEPFVRRLDYE